MGTPTPNLSRNTFDAVKAYLHMTLQQGVPVTDADINELQDNILWRVSRAFDILVGFDTTQVTVPAALYGFVTPVDPSKSWPADAPTVAATPESWFPGSMRPWVDTGGLANDLYVMWGPAWVDGLFVEDTDQRGPAGLYSDLGHIVTHGKVSGLPGGTTFEDDSKDFTPASGSLHLTGAAGGVGNGTARPCRVRFTSGAESGNTYDITAVPTSARLALSGGGAWGVGDDYIVLSNDIVFVNGQVEKVWLCVWVEDQDMVEDSDLEEPTMLLEPSHRAKVRYWLRILRSGATLPTSAARPDYADLPPQVHTDKVFWVHVATITPDAGAPTVVPANIAYTTPGHYDLAPVAPFMHALKSKLNLNTGNWKDIRFADDVGPGATLAVNQHPVIRTNTEGIRFPALAANALSRAVDLNYWDGANSYQFFDVAGWKNATFAGGWGSLVAANALVSHSKNAGDNGTLILGATAEELTTSLANFLDTAHADAKAWIRVFADDAGATADFLSEISLNANFSQDGVTIGHMTFGVYPNDGNNTAHVMRADLAKDAGADVTMAYMFDIVAPTGITNSFAGLRIAGPVGTGTHNVLGVTALQVVDGDVKFGPLGAPLFWYDASATELFLSAQTTVSAPMQVHDVIVGATYRYKYSGARKLRHMYYMDEWNSNPGDAAFVRWLPGGGSPANPAVYDETAAPGGGGDVWPCVAFTNDGVYFPTAFFRIDTAPGQTLNKIVLGVDSATDDWNLEIYEINPEGLLTSVASEVGATAVVSANMKEVEFDGFTPVAVTGNAPKHLVVKIEFDSLVNDVNLFWLRTTCDVTEIEDTINVYDV